MVYDTGAEELQWPAKSPDLNHTLFCESFEDSLKFESAIIKTFVTIFKQLLHLITLKSKVGAVCLVFCRVQFQLSQY